MKYELWIENNNSQFNIKLLAFLNNYWITFFLSKIISKISTRWNIIYLFYIFVKPFIMTIEKKVGYHLKKIKFVSPTWTILKFYKNQSI